MSFTVSGPTKHIYRERDAVILNTKRNKPAIYTKNLICRLTPSRKFSPKPIKAARAFS